MELNEYQKKAVESDCVRSLVIACPGSGKTRVFVERIAYLIEKCKVSPSEIIGFTFTRLAAREMIERLEARLPNIDGIMIGTMHSIALDLIKRFGEALGIKPDHLTVYSDFETEYLLKDIASESNYYRNGKWIIPKKLIQQVFDTYYDHGVEPEPDHPAEPLFRIFLHRCKENNALTYGSLLVGMRILIPVLQRHLHITHLLVDEVQDLNSFQFDIINRLYSAFRLSLFFVGDIDQCLYQFRNARPEQIVALQDDFEIYNLPLNYRSLPDIILAASRVIVNNRQRIPLVMREARI